jgi:hypothetical protein
MAAYFGCGVAGALSAGIAGKEDELLVVVGATGRGVLGGTPTGICDCFCCTACSNAGTLL